MINEDRILKTLTFVNVHKHIKALFIMIIKWLGIIDDTLEKKADLIGGKVPAEQLPSYVDDIIDITTFVTKTELVDSIGKANYTNRNFIVNDPTSDSLYNKIIITNANTSQNDWEIIDPEDGKIYINEANNHSYRWSGYSFVDLDKNFNDRLNVIENKLSIINLSELTNNYDLSTATNGISTLKDKLLSNSNSANMLLRIVDTNNKSYYCKILTRDFTTVNTNISINITDELHNQIINTPAIIFNNVIYFKTSTVDGIKIHFINYEENGNLSELIYTIASKSFTINSVSNTIINKEVIISKAMKNIVPADIFTTSLLQTINIVENANRLNIIVKDNSSIKQTLTILNVSKTLQNGDLLTANYSITCAFNGIIYYGNVENNVYNIIAYKTFYSLLYSSSGSEVN